MTIKQLGLTARQQRFIASEIKAGRYRSEQEIIQAGIKVLQQQQLARQKATRLREAIQKGIDQADRGQGVLLKNREEISRFTKLMVAKATGKNRKA
jgi:putative addiction module CopG family antidote